MSWPQTYNEDGEKSINLQELAKRQLEECRNRSAHGVNEGFGGVVQRWQQFAGSSYHCLFGLSDLFRLPRTMATRPGGMHMLSAIMANLLPVVHLLRLCFLFLHGFESRQPARHRPCINIIQIGPLFQRLRQTLYSDLIKVPQVSTGKVPKGAHAYVQGRPRQAPQSPEREGPIQLQLSILPHLSVLSKAREI